MNVTIKPETIGPDGKVPLWLYSVEKWTRRYPVDAREIVLTGAGSLTGPDKSPAPDAPDPRRIVRAPSPSRPLSDREAGAQTVELKPMAVKAQAPQPDDKKK